ncbi:hypothetical protein ACHWQZ_G017930 [Mnemiopsis leidyi]
MQPWLHPYSEHFLGRDVQPIMIARVSSDRVRMENVHGHPEIDDWDGPQFSDDESEGSDSESEKSDESNNGSPESDESEFQSADDQTPEVPVRRSTRMNKGVPPSRLQMEDWRKD